MDGVARTAPVAARMPAPGYALLPAQMAVTPPVYFVLEAWGVGSTMGPVQPTGLGAVTWPRGASASTGSPGHWKGRSMVGSLAI